MSDGWGGCSLMRSMHTSYCMNFFNNSSEAPFLTSELFSGSSLGKHCLGLGEQLLTSATPCLWNGNNCGPPGVLWWLSVTQKLFANLFLNIFGTNMAGNPKIQQIWCSFSREDCLLGTWDIPRKPHQKPELRGHGDKPADTQSDSERNRLSGESLILLHCI